MSKKIILLVEDEALIAIDEKFQLEKYRYRVLTAASGEQAVDLLKMNPAIDLILMDINLGSGIDGAQAAEIILKDRDIPIIFLSSHIEPEIVEKTEKIRSFGYVVKGSAITVLDASIKMAFKLFDAKIPETGIDAHFKNSEENFGKTEQSLMESLMDTIPAFIYFKDRDSKFVKINKAHADFIGLNDPEKAIGKTDFDFFSYASAKSSFEDEQEIIRTGLSIAKEERERDEDYPKAWVMTIKAPLMDGGGKIVGTFGISTDITEKKFAEESVKHEQDIMQSLLDNVPDLIYFKDRDSKFIKVNAAYATAFGYKSPKDIIGKSDFDIFKDDVARRQFEDEQQIIRTGNPLFKEEKASWDNYHDTWSLTTKMPLRDKKNDIVGTFGISTNITEQKIAEEKIKILLAEKESLLKEVHHRIKNNMRVMESLLSLQADGSNDPTAKQSILDAKARFVSMGVLYDKLYLSDEYIELSAKDYLVSLAREVVDIFPNSALVKIETNIDDFMLRAKRMSSLGIIVNEVITNSMKYAFKKRETGIIKIVGRKSGTKIRISVGDNGIGIPTHIDIGTSQGFGMLLIGTLANQLGGTIKMERNKGSTFVLDFDAQE